MSAISCLKDFVTAYDTGAITVESEIIDSNGSNWHWHEEWLKYAREAIAKPSTPAPVADALERAEYAVATCLNENSTLGPSPMEQGAAGYALGKAIEAIRALSPSPSSGNAERELRVKDEERHEALLAQQVKRADELLRRIAALEKERDKLGRFVAKIMEDWPEGGSFDGGDIQDIAVSCGLLIETTMQEPCGEDSSTCACLEYCGRDEWPLQCFRVSDTLKRVRALGATNA